MTPPDVVTVVAAVVERAGKFLLTRRVKGTHLAGLWEFPGGKCEPGETHDACLERELQEELGVGARVGPEVLTTQHTYPERTVRLHFRACSIEGTPQPLLGQEIYWAPRDQLQSLEFPEADRELIGILSGRPTANG